MSPRRTNNRQPGAADPSARLAAAPPVAGSLNTGGSAPAGDSAPAGGSGPGAPVKRLRWPKSVPVPNSDFGWANKRPELHGLDAGDQTLIVLNSIAWRQVMVPRLDQLDTELSTRGRRLYNSHELETVLLYQHVLGLRSYRAARNYLASDRGAHARQLLGLHRPRTEVYNLGRQRLFDGIPSEASVSRHRTRFGEEERERAYELLFERFVAETVQDLVADPERCDEPLILHGDGSMLLTHYRAAHTLGGDEGPGNLPVTARDAGYVGARQYNHEKAGSGWNSLTVTTATGLPLLHRLIPMSQSEKDNMLALFDEEWQRLVGAYLPEDRLAFFSADGGFNKPGLRERLRQLRVVENIAISSRDKSKPTERDDLGEPSEDPEERKRDAQNRDQAVIEIQGYDSWYADGHRAIHCVCGAGTTSRVFDVRKGIAVARVEGTCSTCGSITITSGLWRLGLNRTPRTPQGKELAKKRKSKLVKVFWRCHDEADHAKADWLLGNSLTYHDPIAQHLAKVRYGSIEGFHGALVTRFGLLDHKHWFRRKSQARISFLATYSVMHALAAEQRRRARLAAALAQPPGSAPPIALAA
jgi:hypothetical protein